MNQKKSPPSSVDTTTDLEGSPGIRKSRIRWSYGEMDCTQSPLLGTFCHWEDAHLHGPTVAFLQTARPQRQKKSGREAQSQKTGRVSFHIFAYRWKQSSRALGREALARTRRAWKKRDGSRRREAWPRRWTRVQKGPPPLPSPATGAAGGRWKEDGGCEVTAR